MGFMQLIKSLDELLYEVMSWLIFYPVTLWRTLRHPVAMMKYADDEMADTPDEQYNDTLSPPLFLLISLILSHLIELAMIGDSAIVKSNRGLSALVTDDTSLLLMRLFLFSLFPLIMATRLIRRRKVRLTRQSLQMPFYSQCYVAGPFALVVGFAGTLSQYPSEVARAAAVLIALGALLIYGTVQARWFAMLLKESYARGLIDASIGMLESVAIFAIVTPLFT